MRVTVFLLRGDLKCGSAFGRSKLECFYVRSQARRFVRLVHFPRQEKYMAVNVSKVGYKGVYLPGTTESSSRQSTKNTPEAR